MSSSSSSSSSPEGQIIGKAKKPWTIGRLLGSGACGSVHELIAPANSKKSPKMRYAIKCTVNGGSGTEQKKMASLLHHEHTFLQASGGNCGKFFPAVPYTGLGGPPGYGFTADKKFCFFVMERMAAPLSEIVPILKKASSSKIALGGVAVALFDCIHAIHTLGYLHRDVKLDNFMLASSPSNNDEDVPSRIRLIDFGLVAQEIFYRRKTNSHGEDDGVQLLVGTPIYASLNVMVGGTPSRGDDLEALGYVICEVILMLLLRSSGSGGDGSEGEGGQGVLPWSHAKSDDELYQIKQEEMDKSKRSNSTLFAELNAAGVEVQMSKYFNEVMNLKPAEKPDYDSLRGHLNKIVVTTAASISRDGGKKPAAAAASPKKPAAEATGAQKSPRRTKGKGLGVNVSSSDENVENGVQA